MSIRLPKCYPTTLPTHGPEPFWPPRGQYLAAMIAALAPEWSVELHCDTNGEAAVIIMPADLDDDDSLPTLIIRTDEPAFHLEELWGDGYRKLGEFRTWADVIRSVQIRLAWKTPYPQTLH